jgi:hypothetical protein
MVLFRRHIVESAARLLQSSHKALTLIFQIRDAFPDAFKIESLIWKKGFELWRRGRRGKATWAPKSILFSAGNRILLI